MKIVIVSHAHPEFSKGGGELAAYYLWQGIENHQEHTAWFIGRVDEAILDRSSDLGVVGERNYLMTGEAGIHDLTATIDLGASGELARLLERIQPDIVHFHHYIHIGIEVIRLVKNSCPQASILMTLHEFVAICRNDGQMVKTNGQLCYRSTPRDCHLCFPNISPDDFFLRERYIKSFFNLVDQFISPSEFLRGRYVDWGIEPERITVLENGLPEDEPARFRNVEAPDGRTRFAYFGQITPYKGIDTILEAFAQLSIRQRKQVSLDIFGAGMERQPPEVQEKVGGLLEKLEAVVHLHGPYEPHEMGRLMSDVDWVIMGSKWWENSPLVIQEAFKFGRPLITPDIGGMAEKVKPGEGGLNYRARDSVSLAGVIRRVIDEKDLFGRVVADAPSYVGMGAATERHLSIYKRLQQGKCV